MRARQGLAAVQALALAAAGAGLVWGATQVGAQVDLTQPGDRPAAGAAPAAVSRTELVCPGADRPGVPGLADPDQSVTPITASAPAGMLPSAPPAGDGVTRATVLPSETDVPGVVRERGRTSPVPMLGPHSLALRAEGAFAPGFAAAQVGVERAASVRGATLVACTPPVATAYLLAGGKEPGRAERIVLTNPAPNPVPVRVNVLGTGRTQDVVVPSRGRQVIVLGSIDDTATAPVVKVTADRGTVSAVLVDAQFAGAVPRGVEVVGPAAVPSTTQLVPAVVATARGRTELRVGVPGRTEAVVRVNILGPDGTTHEDVVRTVDGESATSIPLPALPPGRYALSVTSDEPVVAAAASHQVASTRRAGDLLWMPSAPALTRLAGAPVPRLPGGSAALVLGAADGDRTVTVATTDAQGAARTQTVEVPAGQTRSVDLGDAYGVWIRPRTGPVTAALVLSGQDEDQPLLTGMPLLPTAESAQVSGTRARPAE